MSLDDLLALLKDGFRLPPPTGCPPLAYETMLRCWVLKKELRPTFKELAGLFESSAPDKEFFTARTKDLAEYMKASRAKGTAENNPTAVDNSLYMAGLPEDDESEGLGPDGYLEMCE